jgi:hypothetical protein
MDKVTPHFAAVQIGEQIPNYDRDRELIHQRVKVPAGQDCALVSWIEDDPHTIHIHGAFADHDDAREFYEKMTQKMRDKGQPIMGRAGTINLGYWVAWPPKMEYFQNTGEKGLDIVHRSLREHVDRRSRARQELIDRVEEKTQSEVPANGSAF